MCDFQRSSDRITADFSIETMKRKDNRKMSLGTLSIYQSRKASLKNKSLFVECSAMHGTSKLYPLFSRLKSIMKMGKKHSKSQNS